MPQPIHVEQALIWRLVYSKNQPAQFEHRTLTPGDLETTGAVLIGRLKLEHPFKRGNGSFPITSALGVYSGLIEAVSLYYLICGILGFSLCSGVVSRSAEGFRRLIPVLAHFGGEALLECRVLLVSVVPLVQSETHREQKQRHADERLSPAEPA
jgi:hypothetical protein